MKVFMWIIIISIIGTALVKLAELDRDWETFHLLVFHHV